MNPQGERWTAEQVLALAPDTASRIAGGELGTAGPWSGTGSDAQSVWGLCQGGGSAPYQTVVDLEGAGGPGYRCGCRSRRSPCEHALGLLLLWAGETGEGSVPKAAAPPEWAGEWLAARRSSATAPGVAEGAETADGTAAAAGADPVAARRRAEQRAARIEGGASELEQRLTDLLRDGLASADDDSHAGFTVWGETAARMVDAQAPGLAARVRELASVRASGPGWPGRMLEECALTHLLSQGFLHREELPEGLAATTRSRVGIPVGTAGLLASGPAVRDHWSVLGRQDSEEGRLTARRTWLRGRRTGRMALLLSFGAAGRAPEPALPTGLVLDADLVYYPSARPLRAVLGTRYGRPAPESEATAPPGTGIAEALADYGEALRDDPWLDAWPTVLSGVTPIPGQGGWQLADARTGTAVPVDPRCLQRTNLWQLTAVSGGGPVTVFGECGHRGFAPITTWDPHPVPL
ncbi:SWIM zinc finger family protein [Streptomyces palmae]|uniref:SWIM zinc finger family protein n=1 Tax=Streptomyces palmae TaxID=1701085 RepID=A0A4Z0G5W5_9ACTN|nr:SWIM zinc finger family protein [Streptomyces palmae]TGA91370.1 SWIM zinc finger family protein [Streptomyces palmae]